MAPGRGEKKRRNKGRREREEKRKTPCHGSKDTSSSYSKVRQEKRKKEERKKKEELLPQHSQTERTVIVSRINYNTLSVKEPTRKDTALQFLEGNITQKPTQKCLGKMAFISLNGAPWLNANKDMAVDEVTYGLNFINSANKKNDILV